MKALLLGDLSPTEITAPYFKEKNIPELFGDTVSIFKEKDLFFVNLECALTDHDLSIKKFGPALKAPKETAEVLKTIGVTCCGLSNNHIFDFGIKGATDTMAALREASIDHTGFGNDYDDSRKNYVFEKDGEKICIIAVCEHEYSYALPDRMGSRPYDEYETIEDIRSAKAFSDRVIVLYHGGKEMCQYPSPRLMRLCRAMARNGADVVICQHSHCIGAYEKYDDCHILYGQGNFHFGEEEKDIWNTSLAVEYDTKSHEIFFTPLEAKGHGIRFAAEKDELLKQFNMRNESLISGEWRQGWHDFCESKKETYIKTIANAALPESTKKENARFGHYLDCEAHTDVWRELFPTYNLTNEK